ncbi:MAG: hypothetical protein JWM10_1200 [Myxococcaceae bacterium]|nr:hypothetical protein [Myxococcaceae bacterium]
MGWPRPLTPSPGVTLGPAMPTNPPRPTRRSPLLALVKVVLSLLWLALVVVVPLLGAWVASSLAAHAGASTRLALASGLLLFPVLPVLWESFAAWRRARKAPGRKRFLTLTDRLVLRTLFVSLLFVGVLLARDPRRAFEALNGRGDWMLDGRHDRRAESARRGLFWLAAKSAWLYRLTDDNPVHDDTHHRQPTPRPLPERAFSIAAATPPPPESTTAAPAAPSPPEPPLEAPRPRDPHAWPWPVDGLHPAVLALTPADETSPRAVGRFLAARERDPWQLARAVHDYVADRVAYDVRSYRRGVYPPQDADTVFRTHLSVCAGYAALFEAVGRAAGLTVRTVEGRARYMVTEGMGEGHAWNAVKLDGRWYLIDTTWDAGGVDTDGFHKGYHTYYFLTPPEALLATHYPDEARWQLLPVARTPGEYMRAPALEPGFFANGLRLIAPTRAESDARGSVEVTLDNPQAVFVRVTVHAEGEMAVECALTGAEHLTARCPLTGDDAHEVTVYATRERYAYFEQLGSLRVHNR